MDSRLSRENALLHRVCDRLVNASDRTDLEDGVCEAVAGVDGVSYAWLGTRRMTETVAPQASAPPDDRVERALEPTAGGDGPVGRALSDREPAVMAVDAVADEERRNAATARGAEQVAAVPLLWSDALYGVLVAHASREAALAGEFVSVLSEVGALVGAALAASERRRRLHAGRLVELDLRVTDCGLFPYDTTRALDCRATMLGYTDDDGAFTVTFAVTGSDATAERVREAADDCVRVYEPPSGGLVVETTRSAGSVLGALADVGATLADGSVENGTARLTARLAPGATIPAVVDRLDAVAATVSVASKREIDRADATREGALDALTDRQRTVLTAAYESGYFEWPRDTSGDDLAADLDIAPATFHQHLRAAHRNLLDELLAE
ncbi:helix-turn-helix domain-containing protein [Salarchaeum sp. JOR-1]|uniref:helix-turn-helix domain-containing protein n=1 Tax=Salarchaeum sp. JOR-1 TaxID=2599399 RepID=UPI0011988128|nr:helix-turn-helix domain-containing protein [Salarchaeum sp. JOR-1]QDX41721.1 GAF domain-containing protein [Salarchaeum sp. JOR-1]